MIEAKEMRAGATATGVAPEVLTYALQPSNLCGTGLTWEHRSGGIEIGILTITGTGLENGIETTTIIAQVGERDLVSDRDLETAIM